MRIVLTGGGTGGHIYPGLTLWRKLKEVRPDARVLYIGTDGGLERGIVERAGLPFTAIRAAGLKRELSLAALRTAWITGIGYVQALGALRQFRPDVVVGTGGYVTLPVVLAARTLRIPAVVWEANARPGLTNRLCARRAWAVAVSFDDSRRWFRRARRVVYTGNPRASEVLLVRPEEMERARSAYGLSSGRRLVVAFMGSRGAETVNEVLAALVPRFAASDGLQFIFITGEAHYNDIASRFTGLPRHVRIVPFVHDMPALLPLADLVITRAGGATLAEICAFGLASILIPSPYVTDNHQEENARRLVERGAARMVREADLTADGLWAQIQEVLQPPVRDALREQAHRMATPHAVDDLCKLVLEAAESRRG
ncbi:MAG: undecaprenyldiphospho-muramoylpentapeptide beta-N-acetylglucosaminyltransferase [Thermoflavifilum sp.]|nr:undecaprenyldiphospho-muramoylpentapeptide beta-N-acetylglucosaminyltransferase [Thermoflavifilum sp.]MCL6513268.1 undecaprenyldiphospho-muramoylpentapeptide beta-N-acetylglucosaminyltransferase [Alicyclobacillus sp.]